MNQLCACRSVSGALLLTALCGLLSAPPAYAEEDARRATPPPGEALVFVFRIDTEPVAARVPVVVNTVLVGELENGTFITATVGPGRTYLRIGDRVLSTLSFVAAANLSYFVRVNAIHGQILVRTEVHPVSDAEGRRALAQSSFVGVAPAASALRPQPPSAPATAAPPTQQPSHAATPAATQPAAAREMSSSTESGRDWKLALIANGGVFKMAAADQVVAGLARTYDTTSKSVFGIEAEWRSEAGLALGGEVFNYENDLAATGSTGTFVSAQQKVLAVLVNGKYYFRVADWFFPFVGAGVGQSNATYSGGRRGKARGLAYQGLAGMEFRFNQIGLIVQYKNLVSTVGDAAREVNVGGSGILAGVSIIF
jgi:opacity protein-like surface antigen